MCTFVLLQVVCCTYLFMEFFMYYVLKIYIPYTLYTHSKPIMPTFSHSACCVQIKKFGSNNITTFSGGSRLCAHKGHVQNYNM